MLSVITRNACETENFARKIADLLRCDDVLALFGGLGMGKTAFVRGLADGLGCRDVVSSPTFSIMHRYEGRLALYHFDMYRVSSPDDLYSTGYFDFLQTGAVIVIEWSENIVDALPDNAVRIKFERLGDEIRKITIKGDGRF